MIMPGTRVTTMVTMAVTMKMGSRLPMSPEVVKSSVREEISKAV